MMIGLGVADHPAVEPDYVLAPPANSALTAAQSRLIQAAELGRAGIVACGKDTVCVAAVINAAVRANQADLLYMLSTLNAEQQGQAEKTARVFAAEVGLSVVKDAMGLPVFSAPTTPEAPAQTGVLGGIPKPLLIAGAVIVVALLLGGKK